MPHKLASILVVRQHYQTELALRPFLEKNGLMRCCILDSASPYYIRLAVELRHGEQETVQTEILLPHDAVLLILVDARDKTLGFGPILQQSAPTQS